MVTVALHPFHQVLPPHLCPGTATSPCQGVAPLVVKLIHNQDTLFVGQTEESLTIRIMRSTDMVETEGLDLVHHTGDTRLIGRSTWGTDVMVVSHTL